MLIRNASIRISIVSCQAPKQMHNLFALFFINHLAFNNYHFYSYLVGNNLKNGRAICYGMALFNIHAVFHLGI